MLVERGLSGAGVEEESELMGGEGPIGCDLGGVFVCVCTCRQTPTEIASERNGKWRQRGLEDRERAG